MNRRLYLGLSIGMGIPVWHSLSHQNQADIKGSINSIGSSFLAFYVLGKTIYNYRMGLKGLDSQTDQYKNKRSLIHSQTAQLLLDLSHRNKGLYLKFGQYIGNLQRIVPKQFSDVLKTLQDTAPSVPFQDISIIIEEDINNFPFKQFEKEAFSAASLAQVHRAVLENGQKVAVKLQFPTLRLQTKWDLVVMKVISQICNRLIKTTQYKQLNVQKLFEVWTGSIQEELDFRIEVQNGVKTAQNFKNNAYVHIPKYYEQFCSKRMIVMEYVEGVKINNVQKIEKQLKLNQKKVAKQLISIMAQMIFKYGFVHCDAHPGNILVRKNDKTGFQIVLLDHGMYRSLDKQFLHNFCQLWLAMMEQNGDKVKQSAQKLKIGAHIEYLPLLFMNRTKNSTKKVGEPFTEEQRKYFKEMGLKNIDDIAQFIQDLPPQLMFVIRASNLIALHNLALGGTRRDRLLQYGRQCARVIYGDTWISQSRLILRIWVMEHFRKLYRLIFL